jgi:hypothetical protein
MEKKKKKKALSLEKLLLPAFQLKKSFKNILFQFPPPVNPKKKKGFDP